MIGSIQRKLLFRAMYRNSLVGCSRLDVFTEIDRVVISVWIRLQKCICRWSAFGFHWFRIRCLGWFTEIHSTEIGAWGSLQNSFHWMSALVRVYRNRSIGDQFLNQLTEIHWLDIRVGMCLLKLTGDRCWDELTETHLFEIGVWISSIWRWAHRIPPIGDRFWDQLREINLLEFSVWISLSGDQCLDPFAGILLSEIGVWISVIWRSMFGSAYRYPFFRDRRLNFIDPVIGVWILLVGYRSLDPFTENH